MSVIVSFIRLNFNDKLLVIESLFWLLSIRVMLWIFSFTSVQKKVQKIVNHYNPNPKKKIAIKNLKNIMLTTAGYVPYATCLVQALAGHILFFKYGFPTSIKIGVLSENGEFEAHAWLEHEEKVVLGGSEKKFKTILDVDDMISK
jgi:hypothetical protein